MEATYVESAVREFKGIVVLSAADDEGPTRQTSVLQSYLSSLSEKKLGPEFYLDLLHTLSVRRTHFPHRAFTVSSFRSVTKDLATKLSTVARASRMRNMHFVFTGQGAQWARMGLGLLHFRVFQQSLEDCEAFLKTLGCQWSLSCKIPARTFLIALGITEII